MAFKLQGEFNLKGNALSNFKAVGSALKSVQSGGLKAGSSLQKAKSSTQNAGDAASKASGKFDALGRSASRAGEQLRRGADVGMNAWRRAAGLIGGLKDKVVGAFNLPNAIAAGGVGFAAKSIIDAVGYKEQQLISFSTMLKDSSLALKLYKWSLLTASKTPFETTDVVEASKRLLAARFTLKEIPSMFSTIGGAASSLSLGADGLNNIIRTFGQIRGAGRATTEDLNQLGDAGINVFPALEKAYGLKGMAFRKLLEAGKVGSEQAIGVILKEMNAQFGGQKGMDAQSKSIFGLVSSLKSRPFELFQNLDADKELKPVKNVLNNLLTITDFDNNPLGKKIKSRFISSMNGLFGGVFGNLAKTTNPDVVGKILDKVFDKFDKATAWIAKNGPGIIAGIKSFMGGIGSTINAVKAPLEWVFGALDKLGGAGTGLKVGGGLFAGIAAFKGLNGLFGGGLGKLAGGLFGGGVQKVFVVNLGAGGLGGANGLLNPKTSVLTRAGAWLKNMGKGIGPLLRIDVGKTLGMAWTRVDWVARGLGLKLAQGAFALGQNIRGFPLLVKAGVGGLGRQILASGQLFMPTFARGLTSLAANLKGGLGGLSGTVLGKLGMAAAAFGVGWEIGSAINTIKLGGKDKDGKDRTVGSSITDFFYKNLFGGNALDAQLEKDRAETERLKQLRKDRLKNGAANGKAYGAGLKNGLLGSWNVANEAGAALGNQINLGTQNSLGIKSPSRVAMKNASQYGKGLQLELKNQISPVSRAAQVLAASLAASGLLLPSTSSNPALGVTTSPPAITSAGFGALPPIKVEVKFGDIIVNSADPNTAQNTAKQIRQASRDGAEQGLLEAFERIAAMVGGAT